MLPRFFKVATCCYSFLKILFNDAEAFFDFFHMHPSPITPHHSSSAQQRSIFAAKAGAKEVFAVEALGVCWLWEC